MSQDRLSGLAILAIEKQLAENVNYETIMELMHKIMYSKREEKLILSKCDVYIK